MKTLPNWFLIAIKQLKTIGFFGNEPIEIVANRIVSDSTNSYFGNILELKEHPYLMQILSSYDSKKVWFIEDWMTLGTCDDFKDNFYPKVFRHLSYISGSIFNPEKLRLKKCGYCGSGEERLSIEFELLSRKYQLNFCADSFVLCLDFLEEINELDQLCGSTFQVIKDNYGPCFVSFLSPGQKDWLKNTLGWEFVAHSKYWLNKAQYAVSNENYKVACKYFEKAIVHKNEPFAISEFANLLLEMGNKEEAKRIYKTGIKNMQQQKLLVEKQNWWLEQFSGELDKLNESQ